MIDIMLHKHHFSAIFLSACIAEASEGVDAGERDEIYHFGGI